jgi:hypothetical protein
MLFSGISLWFRIELVFECLCVCVFFVTCVERHFTIFRPPSKEVHRLLLRRFRNPIIFEDFVFGVKKKMSIF